MTKHLPPDILPEILFLLVVISICIIFITALLTTEEPPLPQPQHNTIILANCDAETIDKAVKALDVLGGGKLKLPHGMCTVSKSIHP